MNVYLGKLLIARAINASDHKASFSFVKFIFDSTFLNTPMLFDTFFLHIKVY
jgi:hypothetical protein